MSVTYQLLLVVLSLRQICCGVIGNGSVIVESQNGSGESDTLQQLSPFASSVCPPGFDYSSLSGKCYLVITQTLNWYDARRTCQSLAPGAHLVIAENKRQSDAVNEYIFSLVNGGDLRSCLTYSVVYTFFTSGQRLISGNCNSYFVWKLSASQTIPLTYTNWLPGDPNCHGGNEDCIQFIGENTLQWDDHKCSYLKCSICETRAVGQ